jgi:hypothetical protein
MQNIYKNITGWFSSNEADLLYRYALNTDGPILEIGHFLGRSTSVICEAIKDSNKQIVFDSYDLNLNTEKDFLSYYEPIHGPLEIPYLLKDEVISKKLETINLVKANLNEHNLLQYVNLKTENFNTISNKKFKLIFADVLHDKAEIDLNLPYILKLLESNSYLAVHDLSDDLLKYTTNNFNLNFIERTDLLGIFFV